MNLIMNKNGRLFLEHNKFEDQIPVLFRYIKDDNNRKIGVVVCLEWYKQIKFGYAKYNLEKETQKFNSDFGFKVAVGRAIVRNDLQYPFEVNKRNHPLPPNVTPSLQRLYHTARKFYGVEDYRTRSIEREIM